MTVRIWLRLAFSGGLVLAVSLPLSGQDRDRGDDDRGDRRERRFDPTEFFKRMDANGNGQLEPDEVSGRARGFIDRYAAQAGLDPKQPLSIEKLSAAVQQRRESEEGERSESSTTPAPMTPMGTAPAATPAPAPAPASPAPTNSPANPPLVPGFGVEVNRTLPPGFGTPLPKTEGSTTRRVYGSSSSSSSRDRSSSSSSSSNRSEAAQKVRRYAEGLLKQYDENKNGVLEKDEWRKMRGDPEKADKNNDNIITLDELADRLATYSNDGGSSSGDRDRGDRERSDRDRSDRDRSRYSRDDDKDNDSRKSYRFLTPVERLPKGLPTWFARNDANADGQVSMAEYSTSYNDTTVAEFAKYDLDGDGIITPGECLEAEAAAKSTTRTSSTSPTSSPSSSSSRPTSFGRP